MAIVNRVPELLANKFAGAKVNLTKVQEDTGLNYLTVSRWARNRIDRVNFDTLETWCKYLGVDVGEILVRVTDEKAG